MPRWAARGARPKARRYVAEFDPVDAALVPVTQRLREHAQERPGQAAYTFLHEDGSVERLTWAELDARVELLAMMLAARANPGARAVLLYPAGLEFIVAYFACLRARVVAVPATLSHRRRGSRRLPGLLADAGPALVLTESSWAAAVGACLEHIGIDCACLCTDRLDLVGPAILEPADPAATAFLQYTSGSTAHPKGVEVTHANIAANLESIRHAFGFAPGSVMVSWLPLFHDMGLVGSVLAPAAVGFHCVLMAPATFLKHPLRWLQAISDYRGTCAGAPNFGWDYCVRHVSDAEKAGLDLSSLAVAYNGSEPVRAATLRAFAEAFAGCGFAPEALFPCYGMAEATLLVTGGPRGRAPRVCSVSKGRLEANQVHLVAPGSADARELVGCGEAAAGTTVLVVDLGTHTVAAPNRVGEVWVAGPGVARGYWRRRADSEAVFGAHLAGPSGGPFLRTGDLGFLRDGELFLTGRLKELLIVNGRNIYPQDVEEVVVRAIDFIEPNGCAAFALEVDGRERLAVVAEADRSLVRSAARGPGGDERLAQLDALVQRIRTDVARQFGVALGQVLFVRPGAFPRTTSGKVQRSRCKAMALAGELQVVHACGRTGGAAPAGAPDAGQAAQASRAAADALVGWLRQYAARRLNSRLIDERRTIPPYVVLDLGNQGFFGLQAPREYGGRALSTIDLMRVLEQLAAVDLTLATMVGVHNGLGLRPLLRFGPAALQRRLLPQLASGRQLAAYAQTEPQAGSNPLAMQTRAVRADGGWEVSGHKHLIGLGAWAGMLTVLARAVDAGGAPLGAIALLVPEDAAGLVQGPEALTMGMRGMVQNTVLLERVFVPDEQVLLAPGEGMEVARDAMGFARLGIGALCVGAMKRCAQLMARYAARREIGTGRLADNPVTLSCLHELTCAIHALEALVRAVAAALDAQAALPQEASLACKVLASELLWQSADRLVQLLGGRGYLENNIAPQLLRDARALRILEGPSETLTMHLGAGAALPDNAVERFIAGTLGRPLLAAELAAALGEGRAGAAGTADAAAMQWLDYRRGELCAWALLLGATEQRAMLDPGTCVGAAAADWARARFEAARLALAAGAGKRLGAAELLARIDGYAGAIGDVEQALPGEAGQLDPLLRRAACPARAPDTAPQGTQAGAAAEGEARASTRQLVHESVMKWLRSDAGDCESIGYDTPFTEIGMDSLATVPIALELEQQTALPIAPEVLYDYQTVNALAAYIDSRRRAAAVEAGVDVAPGATR
jgi:acyl-CoA synthetase (AMP-forming)/AMP-acid ligase II/alkylation response protein AidB-like acyl-CoA dehydrogenase/acyl carrier protein